MDNIHPVSQALRSTGALIEVRLRSIWHRFWSGSWAARAGRLLLLLAGALLWQGTLTLSLAALAHLQRLAPIPGLSIRLFEMFLLLLLSALLLSTLLFALTQIFLSADLAFLAATPIPTGSIFCAKWVEIGLAAVSLPVLFSAPVLIAFGVHDQAPWPFYPMVLCCLFLFATVPISLGMTAATVLVNVFPANRTRDALVFVTLILLLVVYLAVRSLGPERILQTDELTDLATTIDRMRLPAEGFLPSHWVTQTLAPYLQQQPLNARALGLLAATAFGLTLLGAWTFRMLFARGVSRVLSTRGARDHTKGSRTMGLLPRLMPAPIAAWLNKDVLTFVRDSSQWSQLLLLGSLIFIYLINVNALPLSAFSVLGLNSAQAADLLAYLNIGMTALVLCAVGVRFLFAAVSFEGSAIWLARVAPDGVRKLVFAKAALGLLLLWAFALPLGLGSSLLLSASTQVTVGAFAAAVVMAVPLTGLGVGFGAAMPRFDEDNPARAAVSLGALFYIGSSLLYVLLAMLLLMAPFGALHAVASGESLTAMRTVAAVGLAILFVLVSLTIAWFALASGMRMLHLNEDRP